MELDTLGDRKTALFLIMSDTDSTFNFLSSPEQPVAGMPDQLEKTEVVFFKLAKYCEAHDVNRPEKRQLRSGQ